MIILNYIEFCRMFENLVQRTSFSIDFSTTLLVSCLFYSVPHSVDATSALHVPSDTTGPQGPSKGQQRQICNDLGSPSLAVPSLLRHASRALSRDPYQPPISATPDYSGPQPPPNPNLQSLHFTAWKLHG